MRYLLFYTEIISFTWPFFYPPWCISLLNGRIVHFIESKKKPDQTRGFLSVALESLMKSNSSGVLMVVESLSEPGKAESLRSFVVVHAKDFSRLRELIGSAAESVVGK